MERVIFVYIFETCNICVPWKNYNLLVEADNFYHFLGLILCNTKHPQFNRLKIQEWKSTVQQVLYPYVIILKIDWVVDSVNAAQKISLRRLHCHFYGCWIKTNLHKLARVLRYLIWKNLARQYLSFKVMFVFGYFNEVTFVQRKILCQLFCK